MELLKEVAPRISRVALIFHPDFNGQIAGGGGYAASIEAAAPVLGVQVIKVPHRTAAELERAVDAFAAEPNGGLLVIPRNDMHRATILRLAAHYRLPAIYPARYFARSNDVSPARPDCCRDRRPWRRWS